ncbi:hypothetical protein RU86_GL001910 [Lactococcus piscium]|uniref:N-acetylmuramoyl-L-alanine amidase n=1 Tax=Pseudolactococcus piscium TaxID=1364 RepID=A0A2A5S330_9LACT|nr:phage tail tip lysozyme [Lactococcus piscium]PCS07853.1 hypothetical protein RU86_GL001910 [Lactococcus piscium]
MGKHDQPSLIYTKKNAVKLALSTGTIAGAFALTTITAAADTYIVKVGDTLSGIAAKHDTSVSALSKLNNIQNIHHISINQKIETSQAEQAELPKPAEQAATVNSKSTDAPQTSVGASTPAVTYVVKTGDTLGSISSKQGVSVAEIIKQSKLQDANLIYVGQTLLIKPAVTIYVGGALSITASDLAKQAGLSETAAQHAIDIANHLMGQEGFTVQGAAGTLAVAERESGFNPEAINPSGGVAGIFQWSGWSNNINGNRWGRASEKTLSMPVQLELVSTELNSNFKNVKTLVGNATDPKQASLDWTVYYEGVALSDPQTKEKALLANAEKWYDLLKDHVTDTEADAVDVPFDVTKGAYSSTGNTYASGQCTWYVKDIFKARMGDYWGNAKDWAASAKREGLPVDHNPIANQTIAVFQPDSAGADATYGHVAVVIGVNGDSVTIKEMNSTAGIGKTNTRVIPKSAATYIHMTY